MNHRMENVQGVVLDLDGTLYPKADELIIDSIEAAMREHEVFYNRTFIPPMMETLWGKRDREFFSALLQDRSGLVDAVVESYNIRMQADYPKQARAIEGAPEMLERLKAGGYMLGLATGMRRDLVEASFEFSGLDPAIFDSVVTIYDDFDMHGKPEPDLAEKVMVEMGTSPAETIGIGDAKNDYLMAQAAGMIAVAVTETGSLRNQPIKAIEDAGVIVIPRVTDLEAKLPVRALATRF